MWWCWNKYNKLHFNIFFLWTPSVFTWICAHCVFLDSTTNSRFETKWLGLDLSQERRLESERESKMKVWPDLNHGGLESHQCQHSFEIDKTDISHCGFQRCSFYISFTVSLFHSHGKVSLISSSHAPPSSLPVLVRKSICFFFRPRFSGFPGSPRPSFEAFQVLLLQAVRSWTEMWGAATGRGGGRAGGNLQMEIQMQVQIKIQI